MSWTEERIAKLKSLWEGGATASQISEELGGVSRNAVIGKAHRLGLKARPSPVKTSAAKAKGGGESRGDERTGCGGKPCSCEASGAYSNKVSAQRGACGRCEGTRSAAGGRCPASRDQGRAERSASARCDASARSRCNKYQRAKDCLGRSRWLPAARTRRSAGTDPACAATPSCPCQTKSGGCRQDKLAGP